MDEQAFEDRVQNFGSTPNGLIRAQIWVEDQVPSEDSRAIKIWLLEKRKEVADARDAEQERFALAAIKAAQLSADTSRISAAAAETSAKWTKWAAIAAAVSAVIPAAQAIAKWFP